MILLITQSTMNEQNTIGVKYLLGVSVISKISED